MKKLETILLILVGALTISSCKNEQGKISRKQVENNEFSGIKNPIKDQQIIVFQKTLTFQNITFEIITTGEGSSSELTIQPIGLEIDNHKIAVELDGQVVDAEIGDLNADGFPEILIYTISAGSGSYGNVIGYAVNNGKSISQIYFPDIAENQEASSGYMGHDEFTVIETSLARRFPVYRQGDTNNNPTGGTRQIQYKLKDGEAAGLFVIDRISECR